MIAACGITLASFSVCTASRTLTKAPGHRLLFLVGELGLDADGARARIDGVVDELQLAGERAAALGQHRRHLAAAAAQRRERIAEVALRQGEATAIGSSWVIVTSGGELGCT